MQNISARTYELLHLAFHAFNDELFEGRLPPAMLLLHRHRHAHGYFHAEQWRLREDEDERLHEIALNPETMGRGPAEVLSTLAHEMVHHEQHVFGKVTKSNPHNAEWGEWMRRIGLEPVNATDPSKKPTGRKVTHNIEPGGPFAQSCERFLAQYPDALAVFAAPAVAAKGRKRDLSKVKHSCPQCDANVWGKMGIRVYCGDCDEQMLPEE